MDWVWPVQFRTILLGLSRHVTSRHRRRCAAFETWKSRDVTRRVALVGQHGATRSSRRARHVTTRRTCRDVTWRATWNFGFIRWVHGVGLGRWIENSPTVNSAHTYLALQPTFLFTESRDCHIVGGVLVHCSGQLRPGTGQLGGQFRHLAFHLTEFFPLRRQLSLQRVQLHLETTALDFTILRLTLTHMVAFTGKCSTEESHHIHGAAKTNSPNRFFAVLSAMD